MQVSSLEKENSQLEAECRRLKKNLDSLKNIVFQLEALEKENSQLEQENLQLRRSAESLRAAGAKAAQLEAENQELESEKSQLKRTLELLKASSKKTERLEVRLHRDRFTYFAYRFSNSPGFCLSGELSGSGYRKPATPESFREQQQEDPTAGGRAAGGGDWESDAPTQPGGTEDFQ